MLTENIVLPQKVAMSNITVRGVVVESEGDVIAILPETEVIVRDAVIES